MAIFGYASIITMVFSLELDSKEYMAKIVNIVTALIFATHTWTRIRAIGSERMVKRVSRFAVITSILLSFYTSCRFENIFLLLNAKDDFKINVEVNQLSKVLIAEKTVYIDVNDVVNVVGEQKGSSLLTGKIKYCKLNSEEFSLTWEYKGSFGDRQKIKKLQ
jgi:hypothetical protein